jgi:hypothetical protein
MAQHLGVTFNERDLSKSTSALPVPGGAMGVYSVKGPTDKAYLCQSEDDIRRIFGQPLASMGDDGSFFDYNRGLQNAFRFVRAGLPMFLMRAKASGTEGNVASVLFQKEQSASVDTDAIKAVAKGHGTYYNGLSVYIKGIASVTTRINPVQDVPFSLGDNVLPGSLQIHSAANVNDLDDDLNVSYAERNAGSKVLSTTLTGNVTVTYEDNTVGGFTSLTVDNTVTLPDALVVSYEQTTQQRVVRLFIVNDGETDPVTNNLENYLVSYKANGVDQAGNAIFIEDVINGVSEIIDIKVGGTYDDTTLPVHYLVGLQNTPTIPEAAGALAGGTNGVYASADADIFTAFLEFDPNQKNGRHYDILYLFDAGYSDTVKKQIGAIAATRLFPHVYLDPDQSLFIENGNKLKSGLVASTLVQQLVGWRQGLGNMEFASLSGSAWGQITDTFNGGRMLWVGPTYEVGAAAIIVDNTLGSWNSVMGPRRGVTQFNKLAINLYDYRDTLNAKQVNPIVVDERGVQMYYGNKTLKIVASAMQQSHARKTRGRISREFLYSALDYVAENLVQSTFNGLQGEFEVILNDHYGAALESFSVVVGPPATTQDDINNQILRIKVGLIFNQIAEEINITTTVFRNGTDLSVNVA